MSETNGRVAVVGSANMDVVARVHSLPERGATVLGHSLVHTPGGKGANQAVAAARAGSEVVFVGRVGADSYGTGLVESLRWAGVSTEFVTVDPATPSGVALIMVDDEAQNIIAVVPGANGQVTSDDVDRAREAIASCSVLLLQLEIPLDTVAHAARVGREVGLTVILNPAPAQDLSPEFLQLFDVLIPNQAEVGRLSGVGSPVDPASAAHMLVDAGAKAVVVTLGDEGAVVVDRAGESVVPPFPASAVDTTGAGDAFVGNLAHGLAAGRSLDEAARFASAAAALSVERVGAQAAMPSGAQTAALLQRQAGP
jgi:ribokinase